MSVILHLFIHVGADTQIWQETHSEFFSKKLHLGSCTAKKNCSAQLVEKHEACCSRNSVLEFHFTPTRCGSLQRPEADMMRHSCGKGSIG